MNFISLDLELNNAEDNSTPDPKIIQVGVSIGNPTSGIILTKSWVLDPGEPIYSFITNLTGINDFYIAQNSVSMQMVAEELSSLIKNYDCFVNPVTWGAGDAVKLIKDFKENNIYFPHFGRRELDVKQIYTFCMLSQGLKPNAGLKSAMNRFKLKFKGTPHRADIDAENTLVFFLKLLEMQRKFMEIINEK